MEGGIKGGRVREGWREEDREAYRWETGWIVHIYYKVHPK